MPPTYFIYRGHGKWRRGLGGTLTFTGIPCADCSVTRILYAIVPGRGPQLDINAANAMTARI